MNIVCASSVLFGHEAFSTIGNVTLLPEEQIHRDQLLQADALITRSKTRITRELLEGTPVSFVGCAVAGTDHMDEAYLRTTEVMACSAPGCNSNSVAEYVVTALLVLADRFGFQLEGKTLGVIGVGHIGRRVVEKAMLLGLRVLQNDPPRQVAEGNRSFQSLETLLPECDILTLHVPYVKSGPHATGHLVNDRFFEQVKPGALFINAARGEVHDTDSVGFAMDKGLIQPVVLDVWEEEPRISLNLMNRVDIATPHIAGYSYEGRLNGTQSVYEALCRYAEIESCWDPESDIEQPSLPERVVDARGRPEESVLLELVRGVYPIEDDDQRFRAGASDDPKQMGQHFVACRRNYPLRREFKAARVVLKHASEPLLRKAWGLGFQISD